MCDLTLGQPEKRVTIFSSFILMMNSEMTPIEYCREKARSSGSSFLTSFYFLSPEQVDAMTVLYAFCRELDDVVDDCVDKNQARELLSKWRADLAKVFQAALPEFPVNQALAEIVPVFRLPENELVELINGMEMDLDSVRYENFADLQQYCYRVAGVVGLLIARILGFEDERTLLYAEKLGLALQLTNIMRDVGEDALMGRIYLPLDELARFGVSEADVLARWYSPEFERFMRFQLERAQETYREAVALLPERDRQSQKVGLIMGGIYYALLLEMEKVGWQRVLAGKTRLSKWGKLWAALWVWLFGFKP